MLFCDFSFFIGSPLHGSGGHALDEVFLQREIQQHDWDDGNGQRSKLHAVVLRFSGKQVVDHRLQAPQLLAFQECHGEQELIPGIVGGEHRAGQQDGLGDGNKDADEGPKRRAAIQRGRFFQLFGYRQEVGPDQQDADGQTEGDIGIAILLQITGALQTF